MNIAIKTALIAGICLFIILPISAQENQDINLQKKPASPRKSEIPPIKEPEFANNPKTVKMTADRLLYDDQTKISQLRGNVKITYGDSVITSRYATFHGDSKEAFFTGGVRLFRPGTTLTGDKMDVYYNEERAVIKENVRGVSYQKQEKKPGKKQGTPDEEAPLIITCRQAEYFWGNEEAYVDGNVRISKNDKRAYADHGHYSQSIQTVILTDNVRFEQGSGNWMTCPEAVFDIKAETFAAKGGVSAEIEIASPEQQENNDEKSANNQKDNLKELPEDRVLVPKIEPQETDEVIFTEEDF